MEGEYWSFQWWNESREGRQDYYAENRIFQFAFMFIHLNLTLTQIYVRDIYIMLLLLFLFYNQIHK